MSSPTTADAAGARGQLGYLDQAIWRQFRNATTTAEAAHAWLALQCRFIEHAAAGVVVYGEPEIGPFSPIARWPNQQAEDTELASTAERALAQRQAVVRRPRAGNESAGFCIAQPLTIDDRICGVVAIRIGDGAADKQATMRQLQWGAGWLEVLWRRDQSRSDAELQERSARAFDMAAAVLEEPQFEDACKNLVTQLAVGLGCDQVSVGFTRRNHAEVVAVSHVARLGSRMNLIRSLGAAMDEAIDQNAVVAYPVGEAWEYRVTLEHAALVRAHRVGAVLSIPLQARGRIVGALTFERAEGESFDEATINMCDAVASVVGPILEDKRLNDRPIIRKIQESAAASLRRLIGPGYFGRKIALAIVAALLVFFTFATGTYRVTSDARLEGQVQRSIVAPFEGYLASQSARAGETVTENQLLATLDDRDLTLERLRWSTTYRQRLAEYDRALADRERAEANIIRTQMDQATAQIELLDEQLARTRVVSPFDGIIVSGDLSQAVGATLERGQELFRIAPLDAYRIILEVDEGDIDEIAIGQTGTLLIASLPEKPFEFSVHRITPIAAQDEGRNFFRVEARLIEVDTRIRPGMEGVAKTEIDERRLIWIWTHDLVDWIRLALWRWLP